MDDNRSDRHRNRKVQGDAMKIGPNHDPGPLSRANQELAGGTQGKPEKTDPAASGKGNPGPDPTEQPKDMLDLSGVSGLSSQRIGYDSQELRDRLASARNRTKDQPTDAVASSGGIDSARLDTIRRLVESGFYERSEVKQQVADKLADEFIGH